VAKLWRWIIEDFHPLPPFFPWSDRAGLFFFFFPFRQTDCVFLLFPPFFPFFSGIARFALFPFFLSVVLVEQGRGGSFPPPFPDGLALPPFLNLRDNVEDCRVPGFFLFEKYDDRPFLSLWTTTARSVGSFFLFTPRGYFFFFPQPGGGKRLAYPFPHPPFSQMYAADPPFFFLKWRAGMEKMLDYDPRLTVLISLLFLFFFLFQ